jgi:hypothetical protein
MVKLGRAATGLGALLAASVIETLAPSVAHALPGCNVNEFHCYYYCYQVVLKQGQECRDPNYRDPILSNWGVGYNKEVPTCVTVEYWDASTGGYAQRYPWVCAPSGYPDPNASVCGDAASNTYCPGYDYWEYDKAVNTQAGQASVKNVGSETLAVFGQVGGNWS